MYDSRLADFVGRRMCTAGTRTAILVEIRKWADDSDDSKVRWLNRSYQCGAVRSVAYSSNKARIVSGSDNQPIRIWDTYTGEMVG